MNVIFKFKNCSIMVIIVLFTLLTNSVIAQINGRLWVGRASFYAGEYYNRVNPAYGTFEPTWGDCSHFTSQILQAGCAGLCEENCNNFPEWVGVPCDNYINSDEVGCYNSPSGYHRIMKRGTDQLAWFLSNWDRWPNSAVVYSQDNVPNWVGPGTFVVVDWTHGGHHAVYIGYGQGPTARYWAHSADIAGANLRLLFENEFFSRAEFWGQDWSPVALPREVNYIEEIYYGGGSK